MLHNRVTTKDIAAKLKIHQSTVSRALKNDSRISESVRELVRRTAQAMNYRPDPLLSSLAAYRNPESKRAYRATIGWITNFPTREGWREYEMLAYFRGATRRAEKIGYKIDEFWLREPDLRQRRITQILLARNIQGFFFVPQPRSEADVSLDWSEFSAVTFGRPLAQPLFHSVGSDFYRSFSVLMRELKNLGYRRPGFAVWPQINETTERMWVSAFNSFQPLSRQKPIPLFLNQKWTRDEFEKWFLKHRPDVLIANDETLLRWVEDLGFKVPLDVGFAVPAKPAELSTRCSGIDENSELIAEAAVDILVAMINRGETGVPALPVSTSIEGTWIRGETVRRVGPGL